MTSRHFRDYQVTIELQPTDDGYMVYFATVDALLGCSSDGATPEEAMAHLEEAFALYMERNHESQGLQEAPE